MRQQNLRGFQVVLEKGGLIGLRQPHLANRRGRLQIVHGFRTRRPAQALHASGNGARRHQQDLLASRIERRDLAGAIGNKAIGQPGAVVGHQGTAHLDHDTPGLGNPGSHSSPSSGMASALASALARKASR